MHICVTRPQWVNSFLPRQNARNFRDDIFKCIFTNKKFLYLIQISQKCDPQGQINNKTVGTMVWHRTGDKPLPEPMQLSSLTHTCVNRRDELTHWGRDKMADIFQTIFSNAFSWRKMLEFRSIFHWSLFLRVQLTIFLHWFRQWLGADQATSHYLSQWCLDYRRMYASLDLKELKREHDD